MPLTLTKEDGSGKVDANSYASAADGESYHEGHLYATAWTAATTGKKEQALVMATRLIDAQFQFAGRKVTGTQALQWPRWGVPDPDGSESSVPGLTPQEGQYLEEGVIPPDLIRATCELARGLLGSDLSQDPAGEGLSSFRMEGAFRVEFRAGFEPPMLPRLVRDLLRKLGMVEGGSHGGSVKLQRT